jgi:predicted PurR-regulated permease PerM
MTTGTVEPSGGLHWPLRLLIAGASIVIIVAGLKAIAPILSVFLFALLLAMVLCVPMLTMMRHKVPRSVAVFLTLLLVFVVGGTALYMVGDSLAELKVKLPEYQVRLQSLAAEVTETAGAYVEEEKLKNLKEVLDPGKLAGPAARIAAGVLEDLGHGLFILLLTAFFLVEFAVLFPRVEASGRSPRSVLVRFMELAEDVQRYMFINAKVGLFGAVLYAILLKVMNVPFIPTWVVLFFLLGFIPAVGVVIAVVPVLLLIVLEHGFQRVLIFLALFVVVNFVNGNLIKPRVLAGKSGFDVTIVEVFFSLVFWNYVLGPVGVVLAVPLTVTLKKLFQEFGPDLRTAVFS